MSSWPPTRYSLLARLADAGDHEAWLEFQRSYQPAVYRYARSRGLQQADAAEVVQEVMCAVHRAMADWQPSHRAGSFRAWLAEAARRISLQLIRQRSRAGQAVGGSAAQDVLDAVEVEAAETGEPIEDQRWLFFCAAAEVESEVSESTWRAFWQTAVENEPPGAVASDLGFSVGNVYSAKCRVLARIRRRVEKISRGEL